MGGENIGGRKLSGMHYPLSLPVQLKGYGIRYLYLFIFVFGPVLLNWQFHDCKQPEVL